MAPSGAEAVSAFLCDPNQVAVWEDRMHIRCSPGDGDIAYFAYAIDPLHSQQANRLLALADTAYAIGHRVWVNYYTDSEQNPPGCLISNCRRISALSMVP